MREHLNSIDPVDLLPIFTSPYGRAWRTPQRVAFEVNPDGSSQRDPELVDAVLDQWVVEAPWAHPVWHSYLIVLIHLRSAPNMPEPTIYLEGATHEMWVNALNPEVSRQELIETGEISKKQWLEPGNFAAQLVEPSDDAARQRVMRAVAEIVRGDLSPDTDFVDDWIKRFGSNMVK